MLTIEIPELNELWDPINEEFISIKSQTLMLEHSLLSISKWEAKWKKPFLTNNQKTTEELLDYIRCMTITKNVSEQVYRAIPSISGVLEKIKEYIEDPMTATTFSDDNTPGQRRIITSELIYYWMTALQIPFECQQWHIHRLLVLIRICNIENQPKKKMPKREVMKRNRALNAARRKAHNTHG